MKLRLLLLPFSILSSLSFHSYAMDHEALSRLITGKIILHTIYLKQLAALEKNPDEGLNNFESSVSSAKKQLKIMKDTTSEDLVSYFKVINAFIRFEAKKKFPYNTNLTKEQKIHTAQQYFNFKRDRFVKLSTTVESLQKTNAYHKIALLKQP